MEALKGSFEALKFGSLDDSSSKPLNLPTSQSPSEPIRLLAIEKDLAGPAKEAALAKYDAVLVGLDGRINDAMKEGLPPEEFPKVEALREANTLARKILRLAVRVDG